MYKSLYAIRLAYCVFVLPLAACAGVQVRRADSSEAAAAAIRAQLEQYTTGVNQRDPERIIAVMSRDIITTFPGVPDATYDSLAAAYRRMAILPTGVTVRTQPTIHEIAVSGDLGFARVTWNTLTSSADSTRNEIRRMKDLQVWRRESDGVWRFVRGLHFREPVKN